MQLSTHIICVLKLHFIAHKSVSLFSMRSVYTLSFDHLHKVGVRATMDSELDEQISVIKFLVLEGENLATFSKVAEFLSQSSFYSWVSQIKKGRTSVDKSRPGRPLRQ